MQPKKSDMANSTGSFCKVQNLAMVPRHVFNILPHIKPETLINKIDGSELKETVLMGKRKTEYEL